ncbi:MAG: flagellin, partial [Gammaproteobacteria bacterium]|nr:flagellin [Gammaproteobacteria bacterium]
SIAEHGLLEANNVGAAAGGAALSSLSVDSATNAQKAIDVIDNALNTVNGQRGDLGAVNNRLEFTVDNLQSVSQQTSAARSRILDADFAKESASLSRAQVLQQAGTAMLAQANSAPQQVLSILR